MSSFPVLHGTFGEDGTMQGLFELAGLAYVGSGVLGSATGMDKEVMKRLFLAAGLPITKHVTFLRREWEKSPKKIIARLEAALKYPLFVKPANLGSSVGISKAHDRKELGPAIDLAAGFDRKIVVEQAVGGRGNRTKMGKARELEVAVLGNDEPIASVVGEIVPGKEFYDYEAKYLSEGSQAIIPAKLTKKQSQQVQAMALDAFRACDCAGLARVDFLLEAGDSGRLYLNEINTMPGFTSISMYPKLWEASGVKYRDLISRLIELALERKMEQEQISYSRMIWSGAVNFAVEQGGHAMTLLDAPTYDPAKARTRKNILIAGLVTLLVLAGFLWYFWDWPQEHRVNQFFAAHRSQRHAEGLRHLEPRPGLAAAPAAICANTPMAALKWIGATPATGATSRRTRSRCRKQ